MSEAEDAAYRQPEQVGPVPWLVLACLVGVILAYAVLANFTEELRAALWGESGTVTGVACWTHDNGAGPGSSTSCSGAFTADGGGPSFSVRVEGDNGSQAARARLADGSSGTAYVSPTVLAGVLPVGLSLVLAGVPAAATVMYVRHAREQRAGGRPRGRGPERR
ncbi:hypothetical protein AB0I39_16765 [Kitasatospora purpeofusca]|uniref:hypothetical protein n=1 Tax=Kitasatospora purpeofusca TaxID=67352 RepID=UPI0033D3D25C